MFENYDDIVTVNELCHMIKIGKNKAYELLTSGDIQSVRVGKKYIIPKNNVITFVQKH